MIRQDIREAPDCNCEACEILNEYSFRWHTGLVPLRLDQIGFYRQEHYRLLLESVETS